MPADDSGFADHEDAKPKVTWLEQSLWKAISNSPAEHKSGTAGWLSAWLGILASRIGNVRVGALFELDGNALNAVVEYPEGAVPPTALTLEVHRAVKAGTGVATTLEGDGAIAVCALPIEFDGGAKWVLALALADATQDRIRVTLREMQWSAAWLREQEWAKAAGNSNASLERLRMATEALVAALDRTRFVEAAMTTVTELARRFDCDRVSIGFSKRRRQKIVAISHAARFAERMQIVQLVQSAMEEACDQRMAMIFPSQDQAPYQRAHEVLSRKLGSSQILSIPMLSGDRIYGAVTMERSGDAFTQENVEALQTIAAMVGPVLEEKRLNDRWLLWKVLETLGRQLKFTLGPTHFTRKIVLLVAAAIVGFFWWATAPYKVTADAAIEGTVRRALVAPFDGFILTADVRAGDAVAKGQVLAKLDDADLALERLRWVTERQQYELSYEDALGQRLRADAALAKIGIEQAEARVALIDAELERTTIRAPFDGLVISGDLSQSIGTAVSRGDLIFEIAPLDHYRVVLEVDETQIAEIEPGQHGELIVASLANEIFEVRVSKVTPVARVVDGRNVFEVDALVEGNSSRLRPGMEGISKINIEERRLISIWTRQFTDWVRMAHWRWFG